MAPYTTTRMRRALVLQPAIDTTQPAKRTCPVCGLASRFGGRVCDLCYTNAPDLLDNYRNIATSYHTMIESAWAALEQATNGASEADKAAFDRMVVTFEQVRRLADTAPERLAFQQRYAKARGLDNTFGNLVRTWHAWRNTAPQQEALRGAEEKIGLLETIILMREAHDMDWEVIDHG